MSRPRFTVAAALLLLLSAAPAVAQAPGRLDVVVSADPDLSALRAELAQTLVQVLETALPERRPAVELEQRRWLDGLYEACLFAVDGEPEWRRGTEIRCLRNRMQARLSELRRTADGPDPDVPLPPAEAALCAGVLAPANFGWRGRQGVSRGDFRDRFSFTLPGRFQAVEWELLAPSADFAIGSARLNLTGTGRTALVFRLASLRAIEPVRYVVTHADEEAQIKTELQNVLAGRGWEIQSRMLTLLNRLGGGRRPAYLADVLNDAMWSSQWLYSLTASRAADLRSELLVIPELPETEASNSPFVNSMMLSQGGALYVLAENGHGTAALFRPRLGEPMDYLCKHVAARSTVAADVTVLDDRHACPSADGQGLSDIPWDRVEPYPARTTLDLPEWGGRRPVVRVQARDGYIFPHVFVGALGAAEVQAPANRDARPADHWQPLFATIAHDQVEIRLSARGPLVVGSDYPQPRDRSLIPPTTYYRIVDQALVPVCRVEDRVVPPSGYPLAPGGKP